MSETTARRLTFQQWEVGQIASNPRFVKQADRSIAQQGKQFRNCDLLVDENLTDFNLGPGVVVLRGRIIDKCLPAFVRFAFSRCLLAGR